MTFDNTPAQVVVIEERKKRKGLAWLAGGAALALLLSGGTFALWRASSTFTGGQVVAGDLDLTGCETTKWYDISPDRSDRTVNLTEDVLPTINSSALLTGTINTAATAKSAYTTYPAAYTNYVQTGAVLGHEIDTIGTWRMVPGDTVIAVCESPALVTLEGDNLVAELKLVDTATGEEIGITDGVALGMAVESESPWHPILDDNGQRTYVPGGAIADASGRLPGEDGYVLTNAPAYQGSDSLRGVVVDSEVFVTNPNGSAITVIPTVEDGDRIWPWSNATLGFFGAPNAGQLQGIAAEANSVVELSPATVSPSGFDDLRTDEEADGRASLGQAYLSAMFVVHFVDDGINGDAVAAHCEAWEGEGDAPATETACESASGSWVARNPVSGGYLDKGANDISENDSRYLATAALAKLASGKLVLEQLRWNVGAYNPVISPSPTVPLPVQTTP